MGNKSNRRKKMRKRDLKKLRVAILKGTPFIPIEKGKTKEELLEEQWLSCQTDVNKLVQRYGRRDGPRSRPDESVPDKDELNDCDATDITKSEPLDVIDEPFPLHVQETDDDEKKDVIEQFTLLVQKTDDYEKKDFAEQFTMHVQEIDVDEKKDVIEQFTLLVKKTDDDEKKDFAEQFTMHVQETDVDEKDAVLTEDWVVHKMLCRCCHAEGDFTSVLTDNAEDNFSYEDMLMNCFNIQLCRVEGVVGGGEALRALCGLCSARLRDAHAFSRQLRAADARFHTLLTNNCIKVAGAIETEVKEEVKVEIDADADGVDNAELEIQVVQPKKEKGKYSQANKKFWVPISLRNYCTREGALYTCARCDETHPSLNDIREHLRKTHNIYNRCICNICRNNFHTKKRLVIHKLEEHGVDERYKCNACDKVFNVKTQLVSHEASYHMLGEKIKCSMCDFECYDKQALAKHVVKHKTTKDFHCQYCKKAFLRKTNLVFHERIHTGDKRKECAKCGQKFVQKSSLNYHMAKYHPGVSF